MRMIVSIVARGVRDFLKPGQLPPHLAWACLFGCIVIFGLLPIIIPVRIMIDLVALVRGTPWRRRD